MLLSDRGPVQFVDQAGKLVPAPRPSSVTALLDGVAKARPGRTTWVAPTVAELDARALRSGLFGRLTASLGYEYTPLPVGENEYRGYYDDVGVNILWSILHGIEDQIPVVYSRDDPSGSLAPYRAVNRALAESAVGTAAEAATVAIHDYQLMLAPALVRARRPDTRIIHFSHTPFPTPESLFALPPAIARALVGGMLGADLLGFQRSRWAQRFLDCCAKLGADVDHDRGLVRHRGRVTWVRRYPTPMDVPRLVSRSRSAGAERWALQLRGGDPRRIIARVDRLDPAKNAVRGFQAYGLLLDQDPALAATVRFVACFLPSRERIADYRRYAEQTWAIVDRVNTRHPGSISAHYGDDHERALGLLRTYDVLLVNPVADGLNAVALEGPVVNDRHGAVVLSGEAGSADVLTGAVPLAEPRDVEATADMLRAALGLTPDERLVRARAMTAAVTALRPVEWFEHQMSDVDAIAAGGAPCCPCNRPTRQGATMTVGADRPKGIIFDFDHTLFTFDDSIDWLRVALRRLGRPTDEGTVRVLYDRIEDARGWPEVVAEQRGCQTSPATHRRAILSWFHRAGADAALADALYARVLDPAGWTPYPDVRAALEWLRERRVPVGVVSNVGWDIRPTLAHHGMGDLVDAYVLSCEHGAEKPDVALFRAACDALGLDPEDGLVVGDDPVNDGAAVRIGLRVHLLPSAPRRRRTWLPLLLDLLAHDAPLAASGRG
ncbi:trehalose-6-phosphate synthase [Phytohabitans flavus]|uniref:trehalose-6-phosphate synthase n=1 Tax=Phytohabitans flavus TaxID=1076124 RepID=UPI00156518EF|nr:trehalose-6-phosphate synthase [Phytohabitans flavus]